MEYAIGAFVIVFLLLSSGLLLLFYRDALSRRLSSVLVERGRPGLLERWKRTSAAETAAIGAELIRRTTPGESKARAVQHRLILAGYRQEFHGKLFSASKVGVPVLFVAIAALVARDRENAVLIFAIAGGIGFLSPDWWLNYRVRARAHALRMGLPDLLDLMVVCLEAGLSTDQAAIRSCDEMGVSHPEVAEELGLVMLEVRAGQPRMEAWKRLAERTNVEAIRMFVAILIQADQFGTGISRTLRVHSETMRTQRRMKLEELARKTSVKLVFPLALFIFPSFFVVALGPALILLSEALQ
jgi:tight adherence protein C